jgi:flagellar hook-basal body complex protein FliE
MQIPSIPPLNIQSTQEISAPRKPVSPGGVQQATQSFEQMLNSLNTSQTESDDLVKQLSLGENVDLHTVTLGLEQNDVNFRVALAIRDKLVDAYREVMRMQV